MNPRQREIIGRRPKKHRELLKSRAGLTEFRLAQPGSTAALSVSRDTRIRQENRQQGTS